RVPEQGGRHAAGAAGEQLDAQDALDLAEAARDGGLRQVQVLGGPQDAALVGDGDDEDEVPELQPSVQQIERSHAPLLSQVRDSSMADWYLPGIARGRRIGMSSDGGAYEGRALRRRRVPRGRGALPARRARGRFR